MTVVVKEVPSSLQSRYRWFDIIVTNNGLSLKIKTRHSQQLLGVYSG